MKLWMLLFTACCVLMLGCGFVSFVQNPAAFAGVAYWAAQTNTPQPTMTQFLGITTPVYANTPVPAWITLPPQSQLTTATPIVPPVTATPLGFFATSFWVTTTPVYITETPQPPMTTTPSLPLIAFTTPEPLETPYYRVGTFYMHSDVYIGGPDGFVLRILQHETEATSHDTTYHYLTVSVRNQQAEAVVVPLSDLFFVREVDQTEDAIIGRWSPQNEPLIARNLPSYDSQQLTPLEPNTERTLVLGFVLPQGELHRVGFITNWQHPIEGGIPIWFSLETDPHGPFVDAVNPPPPTAIVLDDPLTGSSQAVGDGNENNTGNGAGRWPTTGTISRGFGCHAFYTGIHGEGFGCPADKPWFHNGVDVASGVGTAIWSPVDGSIIFAGSNSNAPDCSYLAGSQPPHQGLGNFQKIRGSHTLHYLGHLSRFVQTDGSVTAGQTVAEMGSTGCSTGSHLHWIVYENGTLVNPASWAGGTP